MINISIGDGTRKAMKILNIESYPFTTKELKTNFRTLAKQHHSDKGGDDNMMKKLNDAHATLQHLAVEDVSEERSKASALRKRRHKDDDMFALYETCSECRGSGFRTRRVYNGYKDCDECSGTGEKVFTNDCRACKGTGKFKQKHGRIVDCYRCKGSGIFSKYVKRCFKCGGYGRVPSHKEQQEYCPTCDGTGEVELQVFNPVIRKGAIL